MKVQTTLLAAAGLKVAFAYPSLQSQSQPQAPSAGPDFSNWSPPGPGDSRSPCPALNILANYNILPHNGKGITVDQLIAAITSAYSVQPGFASVLANGGLLASPTPLQRKLDLADLAKHNVIEHDGSLSRQDAATGDQLKFSEDAWGMVMREYDGMKQTSIEAASRGKWNRVQDSLTKRGAAGVTYKAKQFILSYGETALYLSALGGPGTGVANVEWVKMFFEQEKLPIDEGWAPPKTNISLPIMSEMLLKLYNANP
ncbi:Cloroperoxidase, partial [Aulographum hederae CBS 113979]